MRGCREHSPAAHDVGLPREHLRQTADNDVGVLEDINIDEIADRLIHDNKEVELVSQLAEFGQIG